MGLFVFHRARGLRAARRAHCCRAVALVVVCLGAAQAHAYDLIFSSGFEQVADAPTSDAEAARFLTMATFGPTPASIAQLRSVGYGQWIDQQLSMPTTPERPYVQALDAGVKNPGQADRMEAWFANAVTAPDQLRQRAAWALSQIMVASDQLGNLPEDPITLAEYNDILARDAFGWYDTGNQYHAGTYYNLLYDVSHSPAMGKMLTFIRNSKPNPVTGYSPDENYAREVMQLFSIGLIERNLDFSPQLDGGGQPIPTYTQATITANARVLTGLSYQSGWNSNPTGLNWSAADYLPLVCYEAYHDEGQKIVLDNQVVPGGANRCAPDIADLLQIIASHKNVAPFIARQLIERFTSSNPTPAYIQRVAEVFLNNGQGVYGDLGAVVKAVLTDPEAAYNAPPPPSPYVFGKAREPLLKLTALWRYYAAAAQNGLYSFNYPQGNYAQRPLGAPSVFNFYLPDYLPPGEMAQAGQYGPEFQVLNESSVVSTANDLTNRVNAYVGNPANTSATIAVDLSGLVALASNPTALVAQLNHDLLYGSMSSQMNTILVNLVTALPASNPTARVTGALQVLLASPEYAIQK
ncbi:DUF1800 domain-containing protein [Dokdonella soli]|uniref:DUF1800 domain-containing protein n=1 Tax=Dokdonella soli TaxID=529810 RepID=A0ABN1IJJ7_9GAMM